MLNESKFSGIISWASTGTSFLITRIPDFTTLVLPQYFRHKNFSSFVRQLNMYDFHKERDTGDIQVYAHPCFIRGDKEKLCKIYRKTSEWYTESTSTSSSEKNDNAIGSKKQSLKEKISILEKNCQDLLEYNQCLSIQLYQSKEREETLEQLLKKFTEELGNLPLFFSTFL